MAEAQEETAGQGAEAPVEKDVVKANGELPESEQIAEIGGKEKEDPTLSTAEGPAPAENGESAILSDEAKDTDRPSPPPKESSSPSEEVSESAKADDEPPTGLDTDQGIEESFLSLVGTGDEDSVEDQTSPDALEAEGEAPKSGETEKELPAEGISTADEPQVAEPAKKEERSEKTAEEAEENPEIVGKKEPEVESQETPESADIPENSEPLGAGQREIANPVEETQTDEPKTGLVGEETPELVDTTKTDEPETEVGDAEAPKSTDAGEPEAVVGGKEETTPKFEETTDEPTGADGAEEEVSKIEEPTKTDEPRGAEFAEEETTETNEPNLPEVAAEEMPTTPETTETDEPSVSEVAAERMPKSAETTATDEPSVPEVAAEEMPKTLETTETDERSVPAVAAEEVPKTEETTETGESSVPDVAAEEMPKTQETTKTDEPNVPDVAAEEIPKTVETTETAEPNVTEVATEEIPKTLDTTETGDEPSALEVATDDIPKTDALEPQIAEDETAKPSDVDEPEAAEVVVDEKKEDARDNTDTAEEPKAEVISKEEDSAAAAGKSTPTVGEEVGEPEKVEEGTPAEVVAAPCPSPAEQELPAAEAEDPSKPKSFFGVVLKPAGSNGKSLGIESRNEDSAGAPSSTVLDSDNINKSAEKADEKEPEADLPADITEQEAVPKEVSPEVLREVSSSPESSENARTESPESVEQGSVNDSSKEAGIPTSAVEDKGIAHPEVSTECPASVPDEPKEIGTTTTPDDASTEPSSTTVAEEAPEEKPVHKVETSIETPLTAAEDTIDRLTEETSRGGEAEEGTSLPLEEDDAVEEKAAGEDGSVLEKQPSLSMSVPKQGGATAVEGETPEDDGLTTPRGTPLMQRVEHLEQKLAQLEGRQSPRSDFASTGQSTPRSSIDSRPIKHSTRYVLEETGSKGTLLERVAALEQKLAFINLHPPSPINGQVSPQVATVSEDAGTEPDSKPAESQTREWTSSGADDDKTPEPTSFEEASKVAEDPVKPNTEEKSRQDVVPAQTKPMAPTRNNSLTERKIRAKAAVGKLTGMFAGCFAPKNTGTHT